MNKVLKFSLLILIPLLGGWFLAGKFSKDDQEAAIQQRNQEIISQTQKEIPRTENFPSEEPAKIQPEIQLEIKSVLQDVPFTSQAPSAQWDNPLFQDACEEASMAMAMAWVQERKITISSATEEIQALANFEQNKLGHYVDTSAEDTAKIMKEYYNYQNIEIKKDISAFDIKNELMKGNIIIVPANGIRLANPFFTPPGPDVHMLVIIGYDAKTGEFITNDPGTKRGEKYRYNENHLFDSIWDYPTGNHHINLPTVNTSKKAMIIVQPK